MKHTPGPWKAVGLTIGHLSGVVTIAKTEKDAHLIAAAPDLLEALKLCLSELSRYDYSNDEKSPTEQMRQNAMYLAQKSIAKAEGK